MFPMTIFRTYLLVAGSLCVFAAPADIFSPPVLTPNASTVWTVGELTNITWYFHLLILLFPCFLTRRRIRDASNPPSSISNKGLAILRQDDETTPGEFFKSWLCLGTSLTLVKSSRSGQQHRSLDGFRRDHCSLRCPRK